MSVKMIALFLAGAAFASDARLIAPSELATLPEADVVVLGEVHDNPTHHIHQAAAVAAIAPKALVFEMLTEQQALRIRPDHLNSRDELAAVLEWGNSGWPDFAMYFPDFAAANSPAFFGAAAEKADARLAITEGAAAVFGGAASLFDLDEALDDEVQNQREAGQMIAHCDSLPVEVLPGMVEAQRLRDAAIARAVIAPLAETGGPVVVITGNGHARIDWGVPQLLELANPMLQVVSVGQFESVQQGIVPFDFWL